MDLRTGKTYGSLEEGLRAGVPESDLMPLNKHGQPYERRPKPQLTFKKGPFGTIKNKQPQGV